MGLLESLGASLGLGQPEIKDLFTGFIDRIEAKHTATTADFRKGAQAGLLTVLDELKAKDVVSKTTYQSIAAKIKNAFGPDK